MFNFKKFKLLDEDILKKSCLNLEDILKYDGLSNIDSLNLFLKLDVLREFQKRNNSPIKNLDYIKRVDSSFCLCILFIEFC